MEGIIVMLKINNTFLKEMWRLTRAYWRSEEKWGARGLLAVIVGLNLGDVYLLVLLNEWNNRFYNALQNYDHRVFFKALGDFSILAGILIVISVYELYFQQMLEIKWRRWMTEHYLKEWLTQQSYYLLQLFNNNTDNPDQRISEDLRLFVSSTLDLSIGLLKATVTLLSFVMILWRLSGSLSFLLGHNHMTVPGYMVWAAIGYAVIGTWLTTKIGRPLVKLNFDQQRYEADFRFSLVRLRENSESIAFYRGENQEQVNFSGRFKKVFGNFRELMYRQKKLTWLTSGYSQLAIIFPFLVAAPRYFSRQILLGGLIQIASAFGRVQDALSFFVASYSSIAEWQAVVNRLVGFNNNIDLVRSSSAKAPIQVNDSTDQTFTVSNLGVSLPNGRLLLDNLEFKLNKGDTLLITGPSGSGKSTLMRTLAGIWPFAKGNIDFPQDECVLFLPQKPYLPLGSLRETLLYPHGIGGISDQTLQAVMGMCKLSQLSEQLDKVENWSQVLSLGEQQRIAFARTLLQQPKWLFLDEATSALDEPTESLMYRLLSEQLQDSAIISVGHRQTLASYHRKRLHIDGTGKWTLKYH
jgi:putative ATP-binding cassette transporter